MTQQDIYDKLVTLDKSIAWSCTENEAGEYIVSVKDTYTVNLAKAASFNFPEMSSGIIRCILAHNGLDWINYKG